MMSLWDALRMNMMISYQELVRTFLKQYFTSQVINPTENYGRSLKSVYPGRRKK